MVLAMFIVDSDKVKCNMEVLLRKALMHDFAEGLIGDIPFPTKHYNTKIRKEIAHVEGQVVKDMFKKLPVSYTKLIHSCKKGKEGKIVALCDSLERLIYLAQEKQSGNRLVKEMYEDTIQQLTSAPYSTWFSQFPTAKGIRDHYIKLIGS
jgi:5'-deoxynucleotidase YfbR-like HD superfamily hydrolase